MSAPGPERQVETARQLLSMLERLSADSYWAHQASGVRGSLLKRLEDIEAKSGQAGAREEDWQGLEKLIARSFDLLEKAAREIRAREP